MSQGGLTLDTRMLWDRLCRVEVCLVWGGRSLTLAQGVLEHGRAPVGFEQDKPVLERTQMWRLTWRRPMYPVPKPPGRCCPVSPSRCKRLPSMDGALAASNPTSRLTSRRPSMSLTRVYARLTRCLVFHSDLAKEKSRVSALTQKSVRTIDLVFVL